MGFKHFLTCNWRLINPNNLFINRSVNSILESQTTGYAQKSVENNLQFPQKPKKPNPPFFQFLQEKRYEVAEKHNLNQKDAVRVVGEMWKNFDINSKEKMTEIYNNELEKYKNKLEAYKQSLTAEQKNELFRIKYEIIEQKAKRKIKKELKELGKPRKPPTPYNIFVSEELKNHGNIPVQTYLVTVANKWKEMDLNNKAKYNDAASKANDKYNTDLIKWENEMIKIGRLDLVRACAISNDNTNDN